MKIDRRTFISCLGACAGGGLVGTLFSPLPWKLMDDIAIWTQNWPWTPVPQNGQSYYIQSVCSLCPGGCGISVRKVGNRPVKIEGAKDYPLNKDGLCPQGLSGLQYLYGPARIKSPLKRMGKRGEGKWQPVGWDEAIAEVTKQLADLRAKNKPNSVAWIAGSEKGTMDRLIERFLTVYGSANLLRSATAQDAMDQAVFLSQGNQGASLADIENADYILSFGSGILDGWGSPVRMSNIFGSSSNKTWIQIEPRLSTTAAKSTRWVAINPGTEGALALGIAHIIIRELAYDINYVNSFTFGFEDWTDDAGQLRNGFKNMVLREFPPDKVSQITGIPVDTIFEIARGFAKAAKPIAICGRGQGALSGSITETLAVYSLNALKGNINQPGGMAAVAEADYIQWPEVSVDETASKGMQQGRIDGSGSPKFPSSQNLLHRLPEVINAANESPVQVLLVSEANPLYTLPDTKAVKKAFDKIPFIVSFSSFMDETAAYADYLLPNHTYLERYQDVPISMMASTVVGLSKPVVRPVYDTRHTGDVIIQMAQSLGEFQKNAFPWKNYEEMMEKMFGSNWDELKKKGYIAVESKAPKADSHTFNTPTAKFEFCPADWRKAPEKDFSALPYYRPVPIEGDTQQFPLVLIAFDSIRLAHNGYANTPFMTKTVDDTVLKKMVALIEINPRTAKTLRLSEGDEVKLSTPKGEAKVKIHLYEGIMPGVIGLPRGLGHTAYTEDWGLAGKGVNTNELIGPIDDPASGLDMAWGIRAKLSRA